MSTTLKVIRVGDSLCVPLPAEFASRFSLQEGDALTFVNTPEGLTIVSHDSALAKQLASGRLFMQEHRGTFQAVAK